MAGAAYGKIAAENAASYAKGSAKTPRIKVRSELSGIEIATLIMLNFLWDSIAFQGGYLTSMQMILSLLFKNNDLIIKIRIFA